MCSVAHVGCGYVQRWWPHNFKTIKLYNFLAKHRDVNPGSIWRKVYCFCCFTARHLINGERKLILITKITTNSMVVEFANIVAGLIPPTCLFLLRWGLLFTCFDIDGKLSGKVMSVTLLCTSDCFLYSPRKSFAFLLSYERKNENIHITRLMENQVHRLSSKMLMMRYHSFVRDILPYS